MLTFFCMRASRDGELAPVQVGDLDGLLHAMDVRGEAGEDHASLGLGEDLVEGLADDALGGGGARLLGVRGVGEQGEHALLAELSEGVHVGDAAVDRRVVELVVAGEDDRAAGCVDHDRQGVGHAVADGDERDVERAQVEARPSRSPR